MKQPLRTPGSRHRRPGRAAALLALATVNACFGPNWQPMSVPHPKPLEPGTVVEFHVLPDSLVRLHGVRFTTDSISGIPWLDHLSCDTCRVSFPLVRISQLRTGSPGSTALNILVPFIVVIAGLASIAASWPKD